MNDDPDFEAVARDRELAWQLYDARPDHPQIPVLARSVLARNPASTGMIILTAMHLQSVGSGAENIDEARSLLQDLIGRRDRQFTQAVKELRDLEFTQKNYAEARRLAEVVLRDPESFWLDTMVYGNCLIFTGEPERGWDLFDVAIQSIGESDPEAHTEALGYRAVSLLSSGAPVERFHAAAALAIAADPTDLNLAVALGYSYLYSYQFAEAGAQFRRVLREDPENPHAYGGLITVRPLLEALESGDATLDDYRSAGTGEMLWGILRDELFGIGVDQALAALEAVMPNGLAASLFPGISREAARDSGGVSKLLAWRNGQTPGTGALWGTGNTFRLMSAAEIDAMDKAVEREPEAWPQWQGEREFYLQLFTNDAGAYVIEGSGSRLFVRGAGAQDQPFAASLAAWLWDRVVAFGGEDPRPPGLAREHEKVR